MKNNITLVITMHNQKELLEVGVKWLNDTALVNQVIFVDNGSDDGTAELLPEMGYDYIIFDEGKQGYGVVWNAVIDNFPLEEVVIFMDIQYFVGRNCLTTLAGAVQIEKNGVAAPKSNGFRGVQYAPIDSIDTLLKKEDECANGKPDGKFVPVVGVDAGIWAISRESLVKNGVFNENIIEAESVLVDYELRMIQAGYRIVVCKEAFVFDLYNGANSDGSKGAQHEGDRKILKSSWNMNYFNRVPNSNLTSLIKETRDAEFQVLEVGCDLGATLLEIQDKYPNSNIYGMEINSAAVNIAKNYVDVKEGNIEEENVPFQEKFDYIIFGDVLEHLHDPEKTIRFCKDKLLKEQGCIIASIPNLMHISVMQQLLRGRFEYQDVGLLDKTHIHFFTYHEIILMFQRVGFIVEQTNATRMRLTEEQEKLKMNLLDISQDVEEHMYDTFQYIICARCK